MNKKYIVFDLDGTLLDTIGDLTNACNYALISLSYKKIDINTVRMCIGDGLYNLILRLIKIVSKREEIDKEEILNGCSYFVEYYKIHLMDETKPFKGIVNLLEKLNQDGYQCYILSNKDDFAVKMLSKKYFGDLITNALGHVDGIPIKPNPELLFYLLGDHQKEDVLLVGDSLTDASMMIKSNVDGILVSWGYCDRARLEESLYLIVDDVDSLYKNIIN